MGSPQTVVVDWASGACVPLALLLQCHVGCAAGCPCVEDSAQSNHLNTASWFRCFSSRLWRCPDYAMPDAKPVPNAHNLYMPTEFAGIRTILTAAINHT